MNSLPVGHEVWAIAEGYIPSQSASSDYARVSHEAAYILNSSDEDAEISIMLFFTDREPCGPYRTKVGARRTLHLRFNDLSDPELPRELRVDYRIDGADRCTYGDSTPEIRISRCSRQ